MDSNPSPTSASPSHRAISSAATTSRPRRVPLTGSRSRRLRFELRLKLWFLALSVPTVALTAALTFALTSSILVSVVTSSFVALALAIATSFLFERIIRPLQTMSNVVAALREDDFSFRARGARRGDSLGDLALEINALASTLQRQRVAAVDALSLVEIVMNSMPSPILAFDADRRLRLANPSAETAFHLSASRAIGRTAEALHLERLFAESGNHTRKPQIRAAETDELNPSMLLTEGLWSIDHTSIRLHGVPHTLFVLTDVSAVLRDEERSAWQRLIRVLSHEINNSLTPIKSIAGSLRSRVKHSTAAPAEVTDLEASFDRGLSVIEDRAESLNRFLQAYQHLSRLPAPVLQPLPLGTLLSQVVQLETRVAVRIVAGPPTSVLADPDQIQQLFINLIRNAADAALQRENSGAQLEVTISWLKSGTHAIVQLLDNGEGLLNESNLFVPFYTTKPGGTGIGLVLAQQIATAHNGSVRLSNRAGEPGCIAEVSLPLDLNQNDRG
jgi:two-component system nitrogen regulation sensor histidine kinase NtrY